MQPQRTLILSAFTDGINDQTALTCPYFPIKWMGIQEEGGLKIKADLFRDFLLNFQDAFSAGT
jgi:hypothetical protein